MTCTIQLCHNNLRFFSGRMDLSMHGVHFHLLIKNIFLILFQNKRSVRAAVLSSIMSESNFLTPMHQVTTVSTLEPEGIAQESFFLSSPRSVMSDFVTPDLPLLPSLSLHINYLESRHPTTRISRQCRPVLLPRPRLDDTYHHGV